MEFQPLGFLSYPPPTPHPPRSPPSPHSAGPLRVAELAFVLIIFVFPFTVFIMLLCYHKDIDQTVTGKTEIYLLCKSRRALWQGCMVKICISGRRCCTKDLSLFPSGFLKRHDRDSSVCTLVSFKNVHKAAKERQMPTWNMLFFFFKSLLKDNYRERQNLCLSNVELFWMDIF